MGDAEHAATILLAKRTIHKIHKHGLNHGIMTYISYMTNISYITYIRLVG